MHISHKPLHLKNPPHVAVFGCGNPLIGDDGFGPAVIAALQRCGLPDSVEAIDAGTGIREYLLDYLMLPSIRPHMLIVVDTGFLPGKPPGTVRECSPADIPPNKTHDFSLHQFPTVNLLREIEQETEMVVKLFLIQPSTISERIGPGLSPVVAEAIDAACQHIVKLLISFVATEAALP